MALVPLRKRGKTVTLDLDDLTVGWDCPTGDICARVVTGRAGDELVQLRLDLGVMQMFPDGRPDGASYRGAPSALAYVSQQRGRRSGISLPEWQELERELIQLNYRRLALANLADRLLERQDVGAARRSLRRALRDIEACLHGLEMLRGEVRPGAGAGLWPTLVFNLARLRSQLRVIEGRYDEAIEEADAGIRRVEAALSDAGLDAEQCEAEPSVQLLRSLSESLRRQYGISQTTHERLGDAIAREDFEAAANIRDQLRRREAGVAAIPDLSLATPREA